MCIFKFKFVNKYSLEKSEFTFEVVKQRHFSFLKISGQSPLVLSIVCWISSINASFKPLSEREKQNKID